MSPPVPTSTRFVVIANPPVVPDQFAPSTPLARVKSSKRPVVGKPPGKDVEVAVAVGGCVAVAVAVDVGVFVIVEAAVQFGVTVGVLEGTNGVLVNVAVGVEVGEVTSTPI